MPPVIRIYITSLGVHTLEEVYSARLFQSLQTFQHIVAKIEKVDLALSEIKSEKRAEIPHINRDALHQIGHLKKINGSIRLPQAVLIWTTEHGKRKRWLGDYELCQYLVDSNQMEAIIKKKVPQFQILRLPFCIFPLHQIRQNSRISKSTAKSYLIMRVQSTLGWKQYEIITEILHIFQGDIAIIDSQNLQTEEERDLIAGAESYLLEKKQILQDWKKLTLLVGGRAIGMQKLEKLIKTGLLLKVREKLN